MRRFAVPLLLVLSLTACTKRAKLKGVKAAHADVESTVTTINSGTVDAEQQAILGFGTPGRVAKLYAHGGDTVKEGDVLAEQENADLKIIYREAQKEMKRVEQLWAEKLVSRVAYDDGRRALEVARSNFDKSVIVAPFAGIITEVNLRIGETAGPTATGAKTPMRIVDLKPRLVKGDIDEVDLAKVKAGQPARVRIPAVRSEALKANVSRVVPFVDTTKEQDRTSQIELRMTTADAAIPVGASAEIEIVTGEKKDALALPTRAILGTGKGRYVYVLRDGKLARQELQVGMWNYDKSEIVSGIGEGDTVVYPSDEVELKDGLKADVELVKWP